MQGCRVAASERAGGQYNDSGGRLGPPRRQSSLAEGRLCVSRSVETKSPFRHLADNRTIAPMARKVIIDCDPGIDDAIALTMALFDPRLEVLAVTATAGTVDADQATTNVQGLIQQLDPPKYPRIGVASPCEGAAVINDIVLHGSDGLAGCNYEPSDRQHRHLSEKIISELLRQHPNQVSLICLGPLTNVARAFQREPGLESLVDRLVVSGGAVACPGNISPVAEMNMYFDPTAARSVIESATTKSLVPLDVTDQVEFSIELIENLPSKQTRAGQLLHKLLLFAFRSYVQNLGRETISLYDPVALLGFLEPELFTWEDMAIDIETRGELTRGQTVCDARRHREWSLNAEVARSIDTTAAVNQIVRGLRFAGQCT